MVARWFHLVMGLDPGLNRFRHLPPQKLKAQLRSSAEYWALDSRPLAAGMSYLKILILIYTLIFTAPLASSGMMTCRLQRRHFISTPWATNRANKLPQSQRSAVSAFGVASFLSC
jgi:hypothetical protein